MKRTDIFCASQASTVICLSMDQASCSSSNTIQLGGKAIDRHNPIISDSRRSTSKTVTAPYSSSQPPINRQKAKKNSSSKPSGENKKNPKKGHDQKKNKSVADKVSEHVTNNYYSFKPIDSIVTPLALLNLIPNLVPRTRLWYRGFLCTARAVKGK